MYIDTALILTKHLLSRLYFMLKLIKIPSSVQPKQLPHTAGTFVISTTQTTNKSQLCVTDIATKVNHGETKKICVGITRSVYYCIIVHESLL
jgi:hypothetical protein